MSIDTIVLGATGYVAGEALRLLAGHPEFKVVAAVARSRTGETLGQVFGHLDGCHDDLTLSAWDSLDDHLASGKQLAVVSALPHGSSAGLIDGLITRAREVGCDLRLVDLSADFRLPTAALFEEVYGQAHEAPDRYQEFTCGIPELSKIKPGALVAHPGCFTTAVSLACAPLAALKLTKPVYKVSAVTGSTGSGRDPKPGTHHPDRHGGFRAYSPLFHRHIPEMEMLIGQAGDSPVEVVFVPHSGPFARGIHATIHCRLHEPTQTERIAEAMAEFYADAPFVTVTSNPPSLKDVVGSNRCRLGVATRGRELVVFSAIDNLCKGASGGAIQWMNRQWGFPETTGLDLPALGWN